MRQRLIRNEPPLPDDAVLVRALFDSYPSGLVFDREVLVADATTNFDLFGYYGLSLWAISQPWPIGKVLAAKARKARRVALCDARELRRQGLGLVPSGRTPHFDVAVGTVGGRVVGARWRSPSAELLVDRFMRASYTVVENSQFRPDAD